MHGHAIRRRRFLIWTSAFAIVLALAAVLRVYDLRDLPPGLFCDEAALGYNAFSLLETGRDENGELLPLYVWSFGVSYKNPVFIYGAMGPIAALGLDERSVRLTSALFGLLGVVAIAVLGSRMLGLLGGLTAALFLAVCPWHLHFSRIAFELISFPPFFMLGFAALLRALQRNPLSLVSAGILLAFTLYTYAPAKLFITCFLCGVLLLYYPRLRQLRRFAALGAVAFALTATPLLVFDLSHREQSSQYLRNTTILDDEAPVRVNVERVARRYARFFSTSFLFEDGDPIPRHAVAGFGELYWTMAPLMGIGLVWALWRKNPAGKLLLGWLLLFPLAPSLMNEAPSASRGFIGAPAFCLLASAGVVAFVRSVRWAFRRLPAVGLAVQSVAALALALCLGWETGRYWRAYLRDYPSYAAESFQYGYREVIDFMEARRDQYDLLLLTANEVNQPQIFAAFHSRADPAHWQSAHDDAGYLIIHPAEFGRYHMNQRILAALRGEDLKLFERYSELGRVRTPAGRTEYVLAELHERRRFLTHWLVVGPFDNRDGQGVEVDAIPPGAVSRGTYPTVFGDSLWQRVVPQFTHVDLAEFFRPAARQNGRSTDWLCAYAVARIHANEPQQGFLEISGANDLARIWMNGTPVGQRRLRLVPQPQRLITHLQSGANELLVKLCNEHGPWHFTARLTDSKGADLPVTIRSDLPPIRSQDQEAAQPSMREEAEGAGPERPLQQDKLGHVQEGT